MTEAEWLACDDTLAMLSIVGRGGSERKLCLLGCAWWRRAFGRDAVAPILRVVEVVEQVADGRVSHKGLREALASMYEEVDAEDSADAASGGAGAERWAARCVTAILTDRGAWGNRMWWGASVLSDRRRAVLIRCVFGNPFRPVALDPALRTPTVVSLAEAAYKEPQLPAGALDPQRLAVLADALEEAGADAAIVDHLRGDGPHVRGCHLVDLILSRG
jgi:hypothetical protein